MNHDRHGLGRYPEPLTVDLLSGPITLPLPLIGVQWLMQGVVYGLEHTLHGYHLPGFGSDEHDPRKCFTKYLHPC